MHFKKVPTYTRCARQSCGRREVCAPLIVCRINNEGTMEIVIVGAAMPFGPETLEHKSLGGSETAQLMLGKELKKLGHLVTQFTRLPEESEPDHIVSGHIGEDEVRYVDIDAYPTFITSTACDLLICSRQIDLAHLAHQAKKCVFWMHDLATHNFAVPSIAQASWSINEIWCVSEFHRQQVNEITGYPIDRIRVVRNGCIEIQQKDVVERVEGQLFYCARPERGLINLVREGGIMEHLPDFTLKVCMYANFPEHMASLYQYLWSRCEALPNVEMLGSLTQYEVRKVLAESVAYIYPTQFEETNCIVAREAASVGTPFLTTKVGALPESVNKSGLFFEDWGFRNLSCAVADDDWCRDFADFVKWNMIDGTLHQECTRDGLARKDLYWDGVAKQIDQAKIGEAPTLFSQLWSLIEDSDAYAAKALFAINKDMGDFWIDQLELQFRKAFPFVYGEISYEEHYENYYEWVEKHEPEGRNDPVRVNMGERFDTMCAEIGKLDPGSAILDYGCAEGVILLQMAARHPDKHFIGVDFAESNVVLASKYAKDHKLTNVAFYHGSSDHWPEMVAAMPPFDAAICSEVLEHVAEPWKLATFVESKVMPGGRVIITVPAGPWEAIGLYDKKKFWWRAHVWHIDKWMIREMFGKKSNGVMLSLPQGGRPDGRAIGHTTYFYDADHKPVKSIDPLEKAMLHNVRQTTTACIIAKDNEDSILKTLNSLKEQVQCVQIALDVVEMDRTREIIRGFLLDNPWILGNIISVPSIEVGKVGFDDARNRSIESVPTDWILWIDTDEFMVGDIRQYVRDNALDSYSIHQHHFSAQPRGAAPQIDRPARLIRANNGFEFIGKIHEHAELGMNGGPGYASLLPTVDIAHPGYESEEIRRKRFFRNFPFLEWDRKVNPDRHLGAYLWLRDIVHRVRYNHENNNIPGARVLAQEAVTFYEENWEKMDKFGNGIAMSLAYYGEAMKYLDRGLPVNFQFTLGNQTMTLESQLEDASLLSRVAETIINRELEKKKGRYWT